MNIKYIVLLCLTFYTSTVNSIEEVEIKDLWNQIRTPGNMYIVYENFLIHYKRLEDPEKAQFLAITNEFGIQCKECEVTSMNYGQFKEAALEGLIPICQIYMMRDLFNEIAKQKPYITYCDLLDFYGFPKFSEWIINEILFEVARFGESEAYLNLSFDGYKKVVNIGYLVGPDAKAIEKAEAAAKEELQPDDKQNKIEILVVK
ncbi:uncharacterized protein LOC126847904 [Adelges cooleyi]|uniref:uncharacterized protein LOC126847904 n=1 Tax=Adelges cooleyi TaxID=133065 RepID=UPI00217F7FF3|nr:uncharacterized protein LOC126847904 [Adelges cooleyi]